MLVVTGYQLVLTAGVGRRTGDLCSSRRAAVVGEWKAAFVAKRALKEQLPGGAPQPAASADVSLSLSTGEPLGVGKPAAGKPFAGDPPAGSPPAEPVSLLTRAVLALPALMHHASQSTLPKPTHPYGEGSMGGSDWVRAEDRALLCRSAKIDTWMALLLPPLYVLLSSAYCSACTGAASWTEARRICAHTCMYDGRERRLAHATARAPLGRPESPLCSWACRLCQIHVSSIHVPFAILYVPSGTALSFRMIAVTRRSTLYIHGRMCSNFAYMLLFVLVLFLCTVLRSK